MVNGKWKTDNDSRDRYEFKEYSKAITVKQQIKKQFNSFDQPQRGQLHHQTEV